MRNEQTLCDVGVCYNVTMWHIDSMSVVQNGVYSLCQQKILFTMLSKQHLYKDGWTITHAPFYLELDEKHGFVDLAAEQPIAAQKEEEKIAVEIKSFVGKSVMNDLEKAIGQYYVYSAILEETEPDRILYLAIVDSAFTIVFNTRAGYYSYKSFL